jgi:hypothetical protein
VHRLIIGELHFFQQKSGAALPLSTSYVQFHRFNWSELPDFWAGSQPEELPQLSESFTHYSKHPSRGCKNVRAFDLLITHLL